MDKFKFSVLEMVSLILTFMTGIILFFLTKGLESPVKKEKTWIFLTIIKVPLLLCLTRLPELLVHNITNQYENPWRKVVYTDLIYGVRIFKFVVLILIFSLSVLSRFEREEV